MKVGLAGINVGQMAVAEFGPLAALAESLGYESLWTAEHIILADLPLGPDTPRPGTTPFLLELSPVKCVNAFEMVVDHRRRSHSGLGHVGNPQGFAQDHLVVGVPHCVAGRPCKGLDDGGVGGRRVVLARIAPLAAVEAKERRNEGVLAIQLDLPPGGSQPSKVVGIIRSILPLTTVAAGLSSAYSGTRWRWTCGHKFRGMA
jgi:hypothetical protein